MQNQYQTVFAQQSDQIVAVAGVGKHALDAAETRAGRAREAIRKGDVGEQEAQVGAQIQRRGGHAQSFSWAVFVFFACSM
jgi:hypothetical protein